MRCSHCGKELREGAQFCSACGAPVKAQGPVNSGPKQPTYDPRSGRPAYDSRPKQPMNIPAKKPMILYVVIAGLVVVILALVIILLLSRGGGHGGGNTPVPGGSSEMNESHFASETKETYVKVKETQAPTKPAVEIQKETQKETKSDASIVKESKSDSSIVKETKKPAQSETKGSENSSVGKGDIQILMNIYDYMRNKDYEGMCVYTDRQEVLDLMDKMKSKQMSSCVYNDGHGCGAGIYRNGDRSYFFYGDYKDDMRVYGTIFVSASTEYYKVATGSFSSDEPDGLWEKMTYDHGGKYYLAGNVVYGYFDGDVDVEVKRNGRTYHAITEVYYGEFVDQDDLYYEMTGHRASLSPGTRLFVVLEGDDGSIDFYQVGETVNIALPGYD